MKRQMYSHHSMSSISGSIFTCLLIFWACIFASFQVVRAQTPASTTVEHSEYSNKIRQTYNFAFGKNQISAPGNAAIEGDDFIQPGAFPTAKYCAKCHQEAYHQWRQALLSNSFRDPFYRASVNRLIRTKGIEYTRHCDSCHSPIGVLSGALTEDSQVDRSFDKDGLTCMTCHSIQRVRSTLGNGSYVMGIPAVMVDANGNRIPGEVPYYQIMAHPKRHSQAVMKDLYRTPEFCSACHQSNLPAILNGYKFLQAFSTYGEWQNSKYSQRTPLTFYTAPLTTCQGCHMKRAPATLPDDGAKQGTFASHRWLAGNTAVPFYYSFDEQLEKTVNFLKTGDYLNVDLFALKATSAEGLIAPLGTQQFNLQPNDVVQVMVVIQNKSIGHSFIPEIRDLYQAWVEFTVKDAIGNVVYHSGFLKPDGTLDERAHSFTSRPVDVIGDFVDNHEVWTIHSVAYDNTIQSGRSTLVRYEFRVPSNAKSPLTVTARVNYRHLRQSFLNNVFGKDHPLYPIVEIASRTRSLNIGKNSATAPDPQDNPEWMRWNNYGIGLLDEQQYADAIRAFQEVVRLRPDYADGYTNIALTNIQWEKYASARPDLEKALAVSTNNARALYYLAIVEKRSGNSASEIADLDLVVAQYPQSKDVRRELGVAYFQQHKYEQSMQQFQALQAIDPDDLAAHYNLALIYRRMGMKEKSAEQASLFATKKVDPRAPTSSLIYLRKHPEISSESDLWHLHTDLVQSTSGIAAKQ